MRLYLVRHGEAVSENTDPRRPLSQEGRAEVARTALSLKQAGFSTRLFYHSTKLRAQETATILRDMLNPQGVLAQKEHLGPNDPIASALREIAAVQEDLVIAGHMPFLGLLASHLVYGNPDQTVASLKTGSAVILEKDSSGWRVVQVVNPHSLGE